MPMMPYTPTQRPRHAGLLTAAICLSAAAMAAVPQAAHGQPVAAPQRPSSPAASSDAHQAVPSPVPGKQWVLLDPLGAHFQVPSGTQLIHRPTATSPWLTIRDGSDPPTWSIRAEAVPPPPGAVGPAMAVLHGNEVLAKADPANILHQGTRQVGGRHAHEAWVRESSGSGPPVALGWLAVPRRDGQVMLLTAVTTPTLLPQARPVIEAIFDSITPIDTPKHTFVGGLALQGTAEQAQAALPEALRSLDGLRRVIRIWHPAQGRELGFGVISAQGGTAASIRPDAASAAVGEDEVTGLVVTVHVRYAIDPTTDRYLDQAMRGWIAADGSAEQWYLNATRKQRGTQAVDTELGLRTAPTVGQPRSRLMVIRQGVAGDRAPYENPTPDGWLPRPLEWLVYDIMPARDGATTSWASWDPSSEVPRMLLRRDHWTAVPDGTFIVRTWQGMDGLPSLTRMTKAGPAFTDRPDGTRIEVVTDERIAQLWRAAGLKLE